MRRVVTTPAALTAVLAANGGGTIRADDLDATTERVLAANRSARESIQPLRARFKLEQVYPKASLMMEGLYVRRLNDALVYSGKEGESDGTMLVQNGEVRTVTRAWRPGKSTTYSASRMSGSRQIGLQDVWRRLLFTHTGAESQPLPFEQFVRTAAGPIRTSARSVDGREVATLNLSVASGDRVSDRTFELDAAANYLIRKTTLTSTKYDAITTVEVEEFREAKPGVFVPVRCRTRQHNASKLDSEWVFELSDIQVNEPIPPARMMLPSIPSGTVLSDRMRNTRYPVDSSWNRIGPEKSAPVLKVGDPNVETTDYTAQSTDEPRSLAQYVVAAAAAVLAVAAAIWAVRRWRVRSVA